MTFLQFFMVRKTSLDRVRPPTWYPFLYSKIFSFKLQHGLTIYYYNSFLPTLSIYLGCMQLSSKFSVKSSPNFFSWQKSKFEGLYGKITAYYKYITYIENGWNKNYYNFAYDSYVWKFIFLEEKNWSKSLVQVFAKDWLLSADWAASESEPGWRRTIHQQTAGSTVPTPTHGTEQKRL